MRQIVCALAIFLPWTVRRWLLCRLCGYDIHPTSRIGLALVFPQALKMGPHSRIGHLTLCKGLTLLQLDSHASIGRGNWITGYPERSEGHFAHERDRRPRLILGEHSAITNRHLIDCTNEVRVGRFTTIAGFQSQILSHSIDLHECRQSSAPVTIGDYCFVGTSVVVLGGSILPSYSVLGAKSLLNKALTDEHTIYAGTPARPIKAAEKSLAYFHRTAGFIV